MALKFKRLTAVILCSSLIVSCTTSPEKFIKESTSLSNVKVCRNWVADSGKGTAEYRLQAGDTERRYLDLLRVEMVRRNLDDASCQSIVKRADAAIGAGILIGVVAAGAAYCLSSEDCGGGGYSSGQSNGVTSTGFAWDQFYDGNGQLVWRCRDKSNGRFANNYSCSGKYQVDTTWPSK